MADQLVQQSWFDQIGLLRDQGLLSKHNFLGSGRVSGQETPVYVASVPQVRVVTVLQLYIFVNLINLRHINLKTMDMVPQSEKVYCMLGSKKCYDNTVVNLPD